MQIERVIIGAFGPLKNETLELAPGMTVICGPNESAKTSLHAAIYAALCGIRRARGQPRADDRLFSDRHRPWDGGDWEVQAFIRLADGRQIQLSHDLDGGVSCRALDVGLGRDVSNEIMFDGAPDGSRWLGFNRRSFLATACVRQAEIAAVLNHPDALQTELQRAAASAGRDETAAAAIQRLNDFFSLKVGLDRANSTKPLHRAIVHHAEAERRFAETGDRHEQYLQALERVDEREHSRDEKRREFKLAEAVAAHFAAARKAQEAARAEELAGKYPEEPHGVSGEQRIADEVAETLALWDGCPPPPDLSGPTVEELEAQLAQLPERPDGDLTPAQEVLDAETDLKTADQLLASHDQERPAPPAGAVLPPGVSAAELQRLADQLEATFASVDSSLRDRVGKLRSHVEGPRSRRTGFPVAASAVFAAMGVVALVLGAVAVGAVLLVAAGAIVAIALWLRAERPNAVAADALLAAQQALVDQEAEAKQVEYQREQAAQRLHDLGPAPDAAAIRALVDAAPAASAAAHALAAWEERREKLGAEGETAQTALRETLEARDVVVNGGDLSASLVAYKSGCREREQQEREALLRPLLEQQMNDRMTAEENAAKRTEARERLLAVAQRSGGDGVDPAAVAAELREWQRHRYEDLGVHDVAQAEWAELQMLLGGATLAQLKARAAELAHRAGELEADFDANELELVGADPTAQRIDSLRRDVEQFEREAALARGQVEQMAKGLPSVPEAEEELALARNELQRVRALEETLNQTISFLETAQERVHRTIAPVLRETVRKWLPNVAITRDGDTLLERYNDVLVDPETLRVQVRLSHGPWRDAAYLSEGTKEQIYLLLRVALAEHLTANGERTPLILDEVTAQCDLDRRVALLELLHQLSADRQVVFFTHDDAAFEWAQRSLGSGRDRLVVRDPLLTSPRALPPATTVAPA